MLFLKSKLFLLQGAILQKLQLEPLAIDIPDVNYATEDKDGTMKVYKQYDGSFWREARNEIELSRFSQ